MRTLFILFLSVAAVCAANAKDLVQNKQDIEAKLESALAELSELQSEIRKERLPLTRQLRELEEQVSEKRKELADKQRLQNTGSFSIAQKKEKLKARQDNLDYMSNLLNEYGRAFEGRLDGSERQMLETEVDRFLLLGEAGSGDANEALLERAFILDIGLGQALERVGGQSISAQIVTPSGDYNEGTFVTFGPISFFSDGSVAGLSQNSADGVPSLIPLGEPFDLDIADMVSSGKGALPLDVTMGDALAIELQKETLVEHIAKGGFWIYVILSAAGVATLLAILKAIQIYRVKLPEFGALHDVLADARAEKWDEALAKAKSVPGTPGLMLEDAIAHYDEDKELVEEVMFERILEVQPKLENWLPLIAVTAATAPLLGLLGTVTGMINTFKLITIFGTGDAKSLSGGISEALITTEFGLIVAIPALVVHALLSRRVQAIVGQYERFAISYINGLQSNAKR